MNCTDRLAADRAADRLSWRGMICVLVLLHAPGALRTAIVGGVSGYAGWWLAELTRTVP